MTDPEPDLPHTPYMAAVAAALSSVGLAPAEWWVAEEDTGADANRLDAVFQWDAGVARREHWPHGVYLTWDQFDGWRLIQTGGGRNIDSLSPDSRVYCDPRQIAADVQARFTHGLDGWTPGPVCVDGERWDTRATHEAVERWATAC